MAVNEDGNTLEGPEFIPTAMRLGALTEEVEQLLALLGGQVRLTAGMAFCAEAGLPLLVADIPPATNRARRRLYLTSYLAYPPADIQQGHCHTSTNFQLLFCAFGSHVPLIGTTDSFL